MKAKLKTWSGSVLYLSHGGGPLPLLGDESHNELIDFFEKVPDIFAKPSAIIVISAHWEENLPTITSGPSPSLIYDYYGFPPESYKIEYPVPGNPTLAKKLFDILNRAGIDASLTEQRGFDHGLFVPLKVIYPDADIPCIQISLIKGLNPFQHIKLGEAIAGLDEKNVLVLGSGFSFHNIRALFTPSTDEMQSMNESFENWLINTCTDDALNETERENRLVNWEQAPSARFCHPREEHLLPLHVCYGITRSPAKRVFTFEVMGKKASAYLW
jgi:aromatic ring-opening dioxygenase catalytic subunit (LigB family)